MPRTHTRRTVAAALLTGLAMTAAACGGSSDASSTGKTVTGVAGEPVACGKKGEYVIGMSQSNLAEPYRAQMTKAIKRYASKVPQFTVEATDAGGDSAKQAAQVRTFISKDVDLLIISPHQAAPLTEPVAAAYKAGIPVLVLDRKVNGSTYTSYIGADNTHMGYLAGQRIAKELLPNGGNVVVLYGLPGSPPAKERLTGFKKAISDREDIEIVAKLTAEWMRDQARQKMAAALKVHQNIDVVFGENDPMALGAYLAAKSAGRADEIKFTGMDGLATPGGGLVAVMEGKLAFTVVYPTGAEKAIDMAKKILLQCEQVKKKVTLETEVVTDKQEAIKVYRKRSGGEDPPIG